MFAKTLIALGILLVAVGVILVYAPWLVSWFGRLPGDIRIEREGFSFYFPLGTCLLVSALISFLFWLFRR